MKGRAIAAVLFVVVLIVVYLLTQPQANSPGEANHSGHPTPDEIRNLRIN